MQVKVSTTGIISNKIKEEKQFVVELAEGESINDLIRKLELPEKELPFLMFLVNSSSERRDYILEDGDRVSILPVIGGG